MMLLRRLIQHALPLEIVEMIIGHLIYDMPSLLACSLTCYSWYIATVPHLHYTLIIHRHPNPAEEFGSKRPKALSHMHKLGLLPLVKKFEVRQYHFSCDWVGSFSPQRLNRHLLRGYTALTDVEELGIDHLDIPEFMPRIRRYFGHFLPTVRSLALRAPKGSRRQIIYFIGLFQHLEDLKLLYDRANSQDEPTDDPMLTPPFAPPLRGRLTMAHFTRVGLLKDMIDLFGGVRFRHMDLCNVDGMRLLLDSCATTLETLRLYPTDPRGEGVSLEGVEGLVNDFTARSSLRDFDLSRNRSLRTLRMTASSIVDGEPGFVAYVLSTIASPTPLEVIILCREYNFVAVAPPWRELRDRRIFSEMWHPDTGNIMAL